MISQIGYHTSFNLGLTLLILILSMLPIYFCFTYCKVQEINDNYYNIDSIGKSIL